MIDKNEKIAKQILEIEENLNSSISSTLWISDLHGEGDKFVRTIRNSFGVLYQTCKEALPHYFSNEKILYIAQIIKKKEYFVSPNIEMRVEDVLQCLKDVLYYKRKNFKLQNFSRQDFTFSTIQKLLAGEFISDLWYDNPWFCKKLIHSLCTIISKVFLDRLIVLGDIFDRGAQPDKIIKILNIKNIYQNMDLILGNHDILWMGAVAGNRSLIMEAMRITCRYDHQDFLKRMGIDYSKLQKFAERTYPIEKITGKYKAKMDSSRSMEKALSIMQFKLEEKTIQKHPEYEMQTRLWLKKLITMLETQEKGLLDNHFPTLDRKKPQQLTSEEEEVVEDLYQQFFHNPKLKKLIKIFFEKGKVYHTFNSILSIHALIPSNEKGKWEKFLGLQGKELLDNIQETIQRVGQNYLARKKSLEEDLNLFFYLWCGPKSPFFGKDAMKTFERYFLSDKKTHKETTLYWEKNLTDAKFQQKIKNNFFVEHVVFGHTPRDYSEGQKIASEDGFAINIDGGFAKAYLNRGHALVQTPKKLYGVILYKDEQETGHFAPEKVDIIKEYHYPVKVKNTPTAQYLLDKKKLLQRKLKYKN